MEQQSHYVGLDVSLETTSICVIDDAGAIIWRGKCSSDPDTLCCSLEFLGPKRRVSRLDLDQRVQDHRPTLVEIDHIGVHAWALLIVRIQAVNLERLGTR